MGKKLAQGGSRGVRGLQTSKQSEGKAEPGASVTPAKEKPNVRLQSGLSKTEAQNFLKNRLGKKVRELRLNGALEEKQEEADMAVEEPLSVTGLQEAAARRGEDFDHEAANVEEPDQFAGLPGSDNPGRGEAENSRKKFHTMIRKVLQLADVVLEVLDARDPASCRCWELEREVVAQGKRLVLILNKIDLVPKHSVEAWMQHLKRSFPAIAFKAAHGDAKRPIHANTSAANAPEGLLRSTHGVVGADEVMQLLKNYARSGSVKTRVCVGVVGYPNTGKSSLINSMKRAACVQVGGRAGVTQELQEIKLDAKVTLIDSPGVVFEGASDDPSTTLLNVVKVESVADPAGVVDALLQKAPREALMKFYNFGAEVNTVQEFLIHIAKTRGKLKHGGGLDMENAARSVILDWTTGKFRYFTLPPADSGADAKAAEAETASIVASLAPALDIDALFSGAGAQPAVLGAPADEDDDAMEDTGKESMVQADTAGMGL